MKVIKTNDIIWAYDYQNKINSILHLHFKGLVEFKLVFQLLSYVECCCARLAVCLCLSWCLTYCRQPISILCSLWL